MTKVYELTGGFFIENSRPKSVECGVNKGIFLYVLLFVEI